VGRYKVYKTVTKYRYPGVTVLYSLDAELRSDNDQSLRALVLHSTTKHCSTQATTTRHRLDSLQHRIWTVDNRVYFTCGAFSTLHGCKDLQVTREVSNAVDKSILMFIRSSSI